MILTTENGDPAYDTTGDFNLDFFTRIVRHADIKDVVDTFIKAWEECPSTAMEVLMNMRDPRKGKQEKLIPIIVITYLRFVMNPKTYEAVLKTMLAYGCWKDLLRVYELYCRIELQATQKMNQQQRLLKTKLEAHEKPIELVMFSNQLKKDYDDLAAALGLKVSISLCGKWAPIEGSHFDHHPMHCAKKIRALMGMTHKEYRQMLTTLKNHLLILEMLMATGQYDKIDFSKIPATAMKKMNKAFNRDGNANGIESPDRIKLHLSYLEFMAKVSKGETKVKVTGIQPHELVGACMHANAIDVLVEEQWKALVARVLEKGPFSKVVSIVDVSGSMEGLPMQVAIALGLMTAECTSPPFRGSVITFHSTPTWYRLVGDTLIDKVKCLAKAPWGTNTNIRAVFDMILNEALRYQLLPEQMIDTLFIFTDMQFDSATGRQPTMSAFEDCKTMYHKHGYTMPRIVFWNLRSSDAKTLPVVKDEEGVALLSGFSSELLNCIIDAEEFTPIAMMKHVLAPYVAPKEVMGCVLNPFPYDVEVLETAVKNSVIKKSYKAT